jgi:tRNA pseudouridine38-40 synthase
MRYKIILEYNGTNLIGFQKNKDGDSVQSLVEEAIFKFSGLNAEVVACGRTDAGVHAIAMPAHFDLDKDTDAETVKRALNFYLLEKPVSVVVCEQVPDDWHARFSCKKRHYKYVIFNQDFPPVIKKEFGWWIPQKLDIHAMNSAISKMVGNHDFSSFRASECQAKSPIKTLDLAEITVCDEKIVIEFSAKSFLHHQVRNMVGTLVEIGRGKPYDINQIFDARDRSVAGPTAPSEGLFFVKADY